MNLVCAHMCWISKCQSSPGCIFFPMVCSVLFPLGSAKKITRVILFERKGLGLSIVTFISPLILNESIEPLSDCVNEVVLNNDTDKRVIQPRTIVNLLQDNF